MPKPYAIGTWSSGNCSFYCQVSMCFNPKQDLLAECGFYCYVEQMTAFIDTYFLLGIDLVNSIRKRLTPVPKNEFPFL
jgi:hypothetical protein